MNETRIPGRWYWVRENRREESERVWFPACFDPRSAGGWTNLDCWEDFDRSVTEWHLIPSPPAEGEIAKP
jgi:hypothetical protein